MKEQALVQKRIKKLIGACLVLTIGGFALLFFGPPHFKRASAARIVADLDQIRSLAEVLYDGDYDGLNLNHSDVVSLAEDIEKEGGLLVLRQKDNQYCSYSFLPEQKKKMWYCIDSAGHAGYTVTNPDRELYCNENSFKCPPSLIPFQ